MEDASEGERFRRVHRGAYSGAQGRSIPLILRDRSLVGRSHVAVHRRRTGDGDDENMETDAPSSPAVEQRRHLNSTPIGTLRELRNFGELCAVTKFRSSYLLGGNNNNNDTDDTAAASSSSHHPAGGAVSTISVAFSTDGSALASTHGDHTVKITCCHSGRLLRTLEGHPRTPWTVKFHPHNKYVVASGCLGFQVKVWNWRQSHSAVQCINMVRLQCAIISLAFHPTGHLLAVASGNSLYLWDYDNHVHQHNTTVVVPSNNNNDDDDADHNQSGTNTNNDADSGNNNNQGRPNPTQLAAAGSSSNNNNNSHHPQRGRGMFIIEMRHDYALRCVHFPPGGDSIIVGGVNTPADGTAGGMSFSLKLWDFDLTAVSRRRMTNRDRGRGEALRNPVTFVDRALLYNDGGFDVSPCGRFLCACAEYWLPQGVECATSLAPSDDYDDTDYNSTTDMLMDDDETSPSGTTDTNETTTNSNDVVNGTIPTNLSGVDLARHNTNNMNITNNASNARPITTPPRPIQPDADNNTTSTQPLQQLSQHQQLQQQQQPQTTVPMNQYPLTPPSQPRPPVPLSPPSPPGRRLIGGLRNNHHHSDGMSPPPSYVHGRFVPHVVTVSLESHRLGKLLEAAPLDGAKANGVTCVKFSPSGEFCLLGYGVRENVPTRRSNDSDPEDEETEPCHPVTALYRIKGGMTHVSSMMSQDDDVNIARFHPHSGHGFVYGTKQGRVRILSPKPWNYLNNRNGNTR